MVVEVSMEEVSSIVKAPESNSESSVQHTTPNGQSSIEKTDESSIATKTGEFVNSVSSQSFITGKITTPSQILSHMQ